MKFEDAVETYYFVRSKKKDLTQLLEDYPMLFTAEKKIPLNFQLKMTELSEGSVSLRRPSENKFRLSMQSKITKVQIRRNIMKVVLQNRDQNNVFEFLDQSEVLGELQWYYICDIKQELLGPFDHTAMQRFFQDGELKATTLVKKKLMPDFVQMRYLLNKFCRLRAIESVDEGKFLEDLTRNSPTKRDKQLEEDVEVWLTVIGKKLDIDPHFTTTSTDLHSKTDTFSYRKERLSFVVSKQSQQDRTQTESTNPFETLNVKKADPLDRKSFANKPTALEEAKNFSKRRGRYSTATFKQKHANQ